MSHDDAVQTQPEPTESRPDPTLTQADQVQADRTQADQPQADLTQTGTAQPQPDQNRHEELRGVLRAAGIQFLAAVGIAVVAAVIAKAATDGGIVWTGGFLFAGLLLFRSLQTYLAAHKAGARLNAQTWIAVGIAAAIGVAAVGYSVTALVKADAAQPGAADPGPDQVNSCWHLKDDEHLYQVKCSSGEAQFKATTEVTDPQECADGYVEGRTGYYLCLSKL